MRGRKEEKFWEFSRNAETRIHKINLKDAKKWIQNNEGEDYASE
jgi:hypothetical protein